ncbi:Putative Glutamine amidotransferase [Morus notabilis]|uniref:Putative Glutamine amidotransferase n=1 Tax=Morus notabilis TaxID=981085 RepID=W9QRA1_9ROSA|nr:uncharacterized protein LOC21402163 [Morus notabilis]EXB51223.1 Putative Glutamine amidotransferase [Morus notabilis]
MCTSEAKVTIGVVPMAPTSVAKINGRPVLQPNCNRVPTLERRNSVKKISTPSLTLPPPPPTSSYSSSFSSSSSSLTSPRITANSRTSNMTSLTPPISPKSKSPRLPAIKRGNDSAGNGLNSSSEKVVTPGTTARTAKLLERKKSKSFKGVISTNTTSNGTHDVAKNGVTSSSCSIEASLSYSSSLITESPGSIAAVRREQMALQQAQRKMRIAHYGRSKSAKFERVVPIDNNSSLDLMANKTAEEEKRCSFITANSDPIYVAYHDEEWGVPVHDDKMLFELLVLSGAQVGSDWTSILKKRQEFRKAFSEFDAQIVASFTDKQMISISSEFGFDISRVRGVVDNSNRILEIKKELGSLEKYVWGFVNQKPISTQYKSGQRIPVKTSKSETISKDLVRRGFRFVGPTVVHSFMQAAGLTNDHLITCHRHLQCTLLASRRPTVPAPPDTVTATTAAVPPTQ